MRKNKLNEISFPHSFGPPQIACLSSLVAVKWSPLNLLFLFSTQLNERKKGRAAQMVPMEMREAFLEMLELEPNLRPSANYLLQVSGGSCTARLASD